MAPATSNVTVSNCVDYMRQLGFAEVVSLCDQRGTRKARRTLYEECSEYLFKHSMPDHLSICGPEESLENGVYFMDSLDIKCPYGWGCCDTDFLKDWATFASLYVLIGFTTFWLIIRVVFYILLRKTDLKTHSGDEITQRVKADIRGYLASYNHHPLFTLTYIIALIVNLRLASSDPTKVTIKEDMELSEIPDSEVQTLFNTVREEHEKLRPQLREVLLTTAY